MTWLIAGAVVPSFVIAVFAAGLVRKYAAHIGLLDQPGHRKVHQNPTPLGGGLAIWLGMLIPLACGQVVLWFLAASSSSDAPATLLGFELPAIVKTHLPGLLETSPRLWLLMGLATVMVFLGLADDRRGLDWRIRLSVEILVATVLVISGWRLTVFVDLPWLTMPLSVLWVVALVNSFNMLDNMDGLSGGVAAIAAAILAAVMLLSPDPATHQPQLFVAGFLLLLVGSLLGFLFHNRPPARLFMGDAGAYFVGFCLAAATMMATFTGGSLPRHAILAPVCVLAVPFYDLLSVVWIRLRKRKSPFEGDTNHFSHRLVELGLSKPQAVLTIYLATATTGLGALLLYQVNTIGACVIMLIVFCELTLVAILEMTARRRNSP